VELQEPEKPHFTVSGSNYCETVSKTPIFHGVLILGSPLFLDGVNAILTDTRHIMVIISGTRPTENGGLLWARRYHFSNIKFNIHRIGGFEKLAGKFKVILNSVKRVK